MPDLSVRMREICRLLDIKPSRSKGQNFLVNEKIYDDIVAAADLRADETVLEIGPGLGFLTMKLAKKAKRVIAVELDDKLADYLQAGIDVQDASNIEIVNEDILKFNLGAHLAAGEKYKIVANLPYNITSVVLRQFLSGARKPELMVLMLQKEVAERIIAEPGDMSLLAVSVQYYAQPEIVREVKAGNFWPTPAVDSAVVRLKIRPENFSAAADKAFFRLAKFGFSAKRKMLKNNLAGGLKIAPETTVAALAQAGLGAQVRAEDLSVADWQKLFAALAPFMV